MVRTKQLHYYYLSTEVSSLCKYVNSMFLENYGGFQCTRGPIFDPFFYVFPAAFVFFFKLDVRIHQNDINVFYFSEFLAFFTWIQPTRVEELKRPWKNCVVLVAVNDDGRFSGLNFGRRPEFCMAFEMSLIKLWQQA